MNTILTPTYEHLNTNTNMWGMSTRQMLGVISLGRGSATAERHSHARTGIQLATHSLTGDIEASVHL